MRNVILTAIVFLGVGFPALADCDLFWRDYFWKRATIADVQKQLDAGVDLDGQCGDRSIPHHLTGERGYTPLHMATLYGSVEAVQLLIDNWADVNAEDYYSTVPLMGAVSRNHPEVVAALIAGGADVHFTAPSLNASIITRFQLREDPTDVVQQLIDAGAGLNLPDSTGITPLMQASKSRYAGGSLVARTLLEAGAIPDFRLNTDYTALHHAAGMCNPTTARILLEYGASKEILADTNLTKRQTPYDAIGFYENGHENNDCTGDERRALVDLLR